MKELDILLIDDEPNQLEVLKSFLQRRGHNVHTAGNGVQGLEIAKENKLDLVVTDFRMPEMNGLEVLKAITALNPNIDVVLVTAYGNVD